MQKVKIRKSVLVDCGWAVLAHGRRRLVHVVKTGFVAGFGNYAAIYKDAVMAHGFVVVF